MLVVMSERVRSRGEKARRHSRMGDLGAFRFVAGDHLLSAARISGEAVSRKLRFLPENSVRHKRVDAEDESRSVAARIRNPRVVFHCVPKFGGKFGKSVCPGGICTVRRRGVDDFCPWVRAKRSAFGCRCVGKAEKGYVGFVYQALPFLGVFPKLRGDAQDFHIVPLGQAFIDLETGRSGLAIDEYAEFHFRTSCRSWRKITGSCRSTSCI